MSSRIESWYCYLRKKEVFVRLKPVYRMGNPEPVEEVFDGCMDKDDFVCSDLDCKCTSLNSVLDPFEESLERTP